MHVFVWVSYGDATVYPGDTKEDVLAVLKELNAMNMQVGEPDLYNEANLSRRIDQIGLDQMRAELNRLIYSIASKSDDNRFDYGSGFTIVKVLGE